ncbi:hypothetical protein MASR2M117_15690 [Paludibacter sp.]
MSVVASIIKKTFKAILWTVTGLVFLFLLIAGLIQLPFIQNKLVDVATAFVSNKTNTHVGIENIGITFPNNIVIEGIYVEDNQHDTLLYAGKASLHISFRDLMKQHLHIHDFLLQDVYLNVYNTKYDSLFNYQFLIDAFSDTTTIKEDEKETTILWTVYTGKFRLKNIRLRYADKWNKLTATTHLQLFELQETNIQLENLALTCENIILKAENLRYRSGDDITVSDQLNPNDISLRNIELKARNLSFTPGKTTIEIQQLAVEEQRGIAIRKFNTLFQMDEKSIQIKHLALQTKQSSLQADIRLDYPSLESIADSISNLWIDAHIKKASFSKDEIRMFAGFAIPDNIELPERINLDANFRGRLNAFDASVVLNSSFGGATMLAVLDAHEQFEANISVLQFDAGKLLKDTKMFGMVNLTAQVQGKGLDMKTTQLQILADVQALKLMEDDLHVGFRASVDINGIEPDKLNGTVNLTDLKIVQNNKSYDLESLALEMKNIPGKSEMNIQSNLIDFSYDGNISPILLPEILTPYISNYLSSKKQDTKNEQDAAFSFEIAIHDHPLLSELLLSNLEVFVPEVIRGRFDNRAEIFNIKAGVSKAVYSGIEIADIKFNIDADTASLAYDLSVKSIENEQIRLDNLFLSGEMKDQTITALLSLIDNDGNENSLNVEGYFIPDTENQAINLKADIHSLSMKTIETFVVGQLASSSGYLTGHFDVAGNLNEPTLSGELTFKNVETTPAFLNNRIALTNETIRMDNAGIYFNGFTMKDVNNQPVSINGAVRMKNFADFNFDLQIEANNFQLFNTNAKDNDLFYGRMLTDTKINVSGPMELPVVQANIKLNEGSHVSFIVPRTELNTYKGEDVVVFEVKQEDTEITDHIKENTTKSFQFKGIDLASVIEVDKNATLRLFMDPASSDSLVVKGQADLNLTMDRSGKMSLTGSYNLEEGSYQLSFESIIRKKFDIVKGSTIIWNGDPMDANININAAYNVRTSPYNLVADQLGGLSDNQKRPYLQAYPFILLLKMRGELLQPEIGFEIQLPTENQQILGGAVQQKLNQLNEDPSALNKQVFALLLLNRFTQENPLQTESAGTPAMLRSTVSSFLSEQLNKLSTSFIPGLEMNFDLQSYEDYSGGDVEGRTELSVGVKKELFDDRLSIQVGGTVELEGERAAHNQASDIASDVIIEYKLTKDGRYRLKGFRRNQYEGVIDGQLTETGVGAVFVREFK